MVLDVDTSTYHKKRMKNTFFFPFLKICFSAYVKSKEFKASGFFFLFKVNQTKRLQINNSRVDSNKPTLHNYIDY